MLYLLTFIIYVLCWYLNKLYSIYHYNKYKVPTNDFRLSRSIEAAFLSVKEKITIEEATEIVKKWTIVHKYFHVINRLLVLSFPIIQYLIYKFK